MRRTSFTADGAAGSCRMFFGKLGMVGGQSDDPGRPAQPDVPDRRSVLHHCPVGDGDPDFRILGCWWRFRAKLIAAADHQSRLCGTCPQLILVLILWVYYGLPQAADISISVFWAGVLALAISDSAFQAEIFRAGIQSATAASMKRRIRSRRAISTRCS